MLCDTRTDVHIHKHADPHIEKKYKYNNRHINCGIDKKNQRFYNNKFCWYNSYRNYLELL